MSYARQGLIVVILAVLALGGWYAAQQAGLLQAAAPEAGRGGRGAFGSMQTGVPVIAEPVQATRADIRVQAVGTGEAATGVTIYPAVAGEVTEVGFTAGQKVAAGDVLLQLDAQAERLAVELARVAVKDAEVTLSRYSKAAPTGAVSATEVDAARTALERAKLQLEQAQVALADRTVRAPFDGFVGPSEVDPGDRVTTATPITTLDDRSSIIVTFDVPEIYADQMQPGRTVRVTPWSMSHRSFEGVIEATGSRIDPVSRSLQVRARVPNPEDLLRPGMSFVVDLEVPGETRASVPEIAVLWSRDGAYVWKVAAPPTAPAVAAGQPPRPRQAPPGGPEGAPPREARGEGPRPGAPVRPAADTARPALPVAVKVPVQVLRRDRGRVLLEGELAEGDLVVVEGVQRVREGSGLRLVGPEAARLAAQDGESGS